MCLRRGHKNAHNNLYKAYCLPWWLPVRRTVWGGKFAHRLTLIPRLFTIMIKISRRCVSRRKVCANSHFTRAECNGDINLDIRHRKWDTKSYQWANEYVKINKIKDYFGHSLACEVVVDKECALSLFSVFSSFTTNTPREHYLLTRFIVESVLRSWLFNLLTPARASQSEIQTDYLPTRKFPSTIQIKLISPRWPKQARI